MRFILVLPILLTLQSVRSTDHSKIAGGSLLLDCHRARRHRRDRRSAQQIKVFGMRQLDVKLAAAVVPQ